MANGAEAVMFIISIKKWEFPKCFRADIRMKIPPDKIDWAGRGVGFSI